MELKVKDFAAQQGVTDSIIYRHIRNHSEELGEDVFKKGRSTWLTDRAQEYIKDLMIKQPYVLAESGVHERIYELEQELDKAKNAVIYAQNQYSGQLRKYNELSEKIGMMKLLEAQNIDKDKKIDELQAENSAQAVRIAEISLLNTQQAETLESTEKRLKTASDELTEAEKELDFYRNQSFINKILGKKYKKQGG